MKKLWFFIYVMVALFLCNAKVYATENLADGNTANESKFVYLSDVSYDQNKSFAGAGKGIHLDENQEKQNNQQLMMFLHQMILQKKILK